MWTKWYPSDAGYYWYKKHLCDEPVIKIIDYDTCWSMSERLVGKFLPNMFNHSGWWCKVEEPPETKCALNGDARMHMCRKC